MPKKCRLKSPVVEAYKTAKPCNVSTHNGMKIASRGDWILKYADGEHAVLKPDVFKNRYERVKE